MSAMPFAAIPKNNETMEIIHSFFIFYLDGLCVPSLKKKKTRKKMLNKNETKEKEKRHKELLLMVQHFCGCFCSDHKNILSYTMEKEN
jgi:hypothetical protein